MATEELKQRGSNSYLQAQRLSKMGDSPSYGTDFEREFTMAEEETIARKAWETVFARDGDPNVNRTRQTLTTFNRYGEVSQDINNEDRTELIRKTVIAIRNTLRDKDKNEASLHLKRMGAILPELMAALALHVEHINGVYQKDLLSMATIAIDWFEHPESVAQTHIRVGMGGEESANARIPAYIVPALETQRAVKKAFGEYTVWAIQRELFERASAGRNPNEVAQINNTLNSWIKSQTAVQMGFTESDLDQGDLLSVPYQQGLAIVEKAWNRFLPEVSFRKSLPDMAEKYHFTSDVPTLVVFNAAHTAVQINAMDPHLTQDSQKETQELLSEFAREFYPDVHEAMVFQNDIPSEKQTYLSNMLLQYAKYVALQFDGKREHALDILARFGQHHNKVQGRLGKGQARLVNGMSPELAYILRHAFMFGDYEMGTHGEAKFPNAGFMEELPPARHVIFHQASPERTFGVFRKLFAENATVEGFIGWLTRRQRLSELHVADRVTDILQKALATQTPEKALLGKLLHGVREIKEKEPELAAIVNGMLLSERVKNAGDQLVTTLQEVIQETRDETPAKHELGDLKKLRESMLAFPEEAITLRQAINMAAEKLDGERLEALRRDKRVIRMNYPMSRLELQVTVGEGNPVYYPVKDVDTILYPEYEEAGNRGQEEERLFGLAAYDHHLQTTQAKRGRLDKTTRYVMKLVERKPTKNSQVKMRQLVESIAQQVLASIGTWEQKGEKVTPERVQRLWSSYVPQLVETPEGDNSQDIVPKIAVTTMQQVFETIDTGEQQGEKVTPERVQALLASAKTHLRNNLGVAVTEELLEQLVSAATRKAMEETMKAALGEEVKAAAIRYDYLVLLRAIDRNNLERADAVYRNFLRNLYN